MSFAQSYMVNPNVMGDVECPPEDTYTIRFTGIEAFGLGKAFDDGKEPKMQYTLTFKIVGDRPTSSFNEQEWHDFDLKGWYTPILHYYTEKNYTMPKLYALVKAMNGGVPLALPTDDDGELLPYDATEYLRGFIGKTFRATVAPNKNGWPRIGKEPTPDGAVTEGRRRRSAPPVQATVVDPGPDDDDDGEGF